MARSVRKKQTPESPRATYWRGVIKEWEGSGLTQLEFCQRNDESIASFRWWRWQLRKRDQQSRLPRLLPVAVVEDNGTPEGPNNGVGGIFEVLLPRGTVIRIPQDFEPEALLRLIRVLETAGC